MEQRKKLVFGGERLIDPQYCNFPSAVTRGPLHGHPGDEALIVSKEEAEELRAECYRPLTPNPLGWNENEVQQYSTFGGKKLIVATLAPGYVTRKQGRIEDCNTDPRKMLGLKPKRVKTVATPATGKEKDHGD